MTEDMVRAAYSHWAAEYTARLGSMDATDERDRQLISRWVAGLQGPVVDAGCGPGHWTDFLAGLGAEVTGIDLVPEFVRIARTRFPSRSFRVGSLTDLGLPDGSVAGVLVWYSMIHLEPESVDDVLEGLARCTEAGGRLLVGFCRGDRLEPFDHTVTTGYFWPVAELAHRIERAGYVVHEVHTRDDRGQRPHGAIGAVRMGALPDPETVG